MTITNPEPGQPPAPVVSGQVLTPRPGATAGPVHVAAVKLGEVLKDIIHRSGTYMSEDLMNAALASVDSWVKSLVPVSIMSNIGVDMRAAYEDVTQRTPPGGPAPVMQQPGIDYDKLAQALIRAQQAQVQAVQQ